MTELDQLLARVDALESEQAIRVCMNRYMDLCDHLNPETPLEELGNLFTENARWEGKGARYAKSFGGYEGRQAIVDMLAKYTALPAHFTLNVHYLSSEVIKVEGDKAFGSWNMIQVSSFSAGGSHLNSARLSVSFLRENGVWRMAHFETENRFSRPVSDWNNDAALPVPK
ncbi:MAG: nuclear transport factor 2 family protein [Marinomonas sp.]|uniref:nuclear transport factor 2 family protein n=1 Tax=Marinomonas sp. GJ51-6 TaxID=2992802 RepID=UPI0029349432|nr:nuclear transport factor 2 family protein [Marinomonas sp. GJ51-6]WOD07559.1 nuclear transport factor 2 family protein [Marinomonas sp. GJ51-6]